MDDFRRQKLTLRRGSSGANSKMRLTLTVVTFPFLLHAEPYAKASGHVQK